MLSGARTTSTSTSCRRMRSRTRSSFAESSGHVITKISSCSLGVGPDGIAGLPRCRFRRALALAGVLTRELPTLLFPQAQPIESGVQGRRNPQAECFTRNGAAEKIYFGPGAMANVGKHGGGMIRLGADAVHAPW